MKIAMTGVSGNMGREALKQTFELPNVELIRIILRNSDKNKILAQKLVKQYKTKIEIIFDSINSKQACENLVKDMDYVVHMAAVIPPKSDNYPQQSYDCNREGAITLVNAIKKQNHQPKLIHISTIAVYGNRNEKHPFGRVGDPLLISPFDAYAKDKLYAERYLLESELENWVILRQTAMLHPNIYKDNLSDGLMFHTALNAPLEWINSEDSGLLIKNILKRDSANEVPHFWKRIYNIGAGLGGRVTGYDTIDVGFSIIGATINKYFKPNYFSSRNFHGIWIADGDSLNDMFHYQRGSFLQFWQDLAKAHPIFSLGKIVPKFILNTFLFNRLLNDSNSPHTWLKSKDIPKVQAYFGGEQFANNRPTEWDKVLLLTKNAFGNFDELRANTNYNLLSHGYDENKALSDLTLEDLQKAAEFRGGKCLAEKAPENEYVKIKWQCSEGHIFESSVYTILGAGHWCPECTMPEKQTYWRFDYLAKKSPFFAQLWYDSHDSDEDIIYYIDEQGCQCIKKEEL